MDSAPEHERTYDVAVGWALPSSSLPYVVDGPVTHRLVATYHDTDDLRLLRGRVTLRRRTGGIDAGWHAKLPVGPDRREELRLPPGRATAVPTELRELLTGRTRARSLRPVARITTVRTVWTARDDAGSAVAEIADDTVSAQLLGGDEVTVETWREIEVEAVGTADDAVRRIGRVLEANGATVGGPSKLGRLLRPMLERTGPATGRDGLRRGGRAVAAYVADTADELVRADLAVRRDLPDSVHAMRVASRRLRSALQTFPAPDPAATDHLVTELRWLAGALGEVRDREVQLRRLTALVDDQPAELVLGPVAVRIERRLGPEIVEHRARLLAELRSDRYLALLDALAELSATGPVEPLRRPQARARVRHAVRRMDRRLTAALELPPGAARETALHQARKAAKRARYAAEAVSSVEGRPARRLVSRLKALQDLLGDHQDAAVTSTVLRQLGLAAHAQPDESSFTFGLLVGLERAREVADVEEVGRVWRRTRDPRCRDWLA